MADGIDPFAEPAPEPEPEYVQLESRMLDAITEAVTGSKWAVPDLVLTHAVVVMGWTNGTTREEETFLMCGPTWAAEGLLNRSLRMIEQFDDEDDEEL